MMFNESGSHDRPQQALVNECDRLIAENRALDLENQRLRRLIAELAKMVREEMAREEALR